MGVNSPTKLCTIAGCGKPLRARGMCATHYNQATQRPNHGTRATCERCGLAYLAARRSQRYCSLLCRSGGAFKHTYTESQRRYSREKQRARRAACSAVDAETIDERSIYERDGWKCGVCRRAVDRSLEWPHPKSASLDHVVPISEGGAHTRANVRLTHLRCNVARGNRGESVQLALIG